MRAKCDDNDDVMNIIMTMTMTMTTLTITITIMMIATMAMACSLDVERFFCDRYANASVPVKV